MNAERLLAHFEHIADAPDAVARLRRFILDLAVRGKLVPQDSKEEPASELLKRIAAARERAAPKVRIVKRPRDDARLESPLTIPSGWAFVVLSDLVSVINGRAYKQSELLDHGTPVLRVGNLFTSKEWYYSDLTLEEDKYCQKGDLIFAWSASFGPFIWTGDRVIYHYHIWKLPLHSEADLEKRYLYNFLLQKTGEIKSAGHGVSMIHMTKEKMERIMVAIPPLAEQRRIVSKIEELMALCDQLETARAEREAKRERLTMASFARLHTPDPDPARFADDARFTVDILPTLTGRRDQIRQLRQTILNLAVRGKLVQQDPNDEPASEILRRIAMENAPQRRGRLPRSKPASNDGSLLLEASLPVGWVATTLGSISRRIQYGYTASADATLSDVRMVRISDVQDNTVRWSSVPGCVIDPQEILEYRLESGDILIARTGGTVGKSFLVRDVPVTSVFASYLIRVQGTRHVRDDYVKRFLESPFYWDQLLAGARGTGQPNVNSVVLGRLILPLPPYGEQRRIVEKLDEVMALCDRLEASLSNAETTRSRLLDSLLANALHPVTRKFHVTH